MSNRYSLGGYRIALEAKSKKTILVEGKDDKELLNKFRLHWSKEECFDIDSVDILKGEEIAGLGAKAKIDHLLLSIPNGSELQTKIRALVDREWETLIDQAGKPIPWTPPQNSAVRYQTSGHSIENYQFVYECVAAYGAHFGSGLLTNAVSAAIKSAFPEILFFCAAYSAAVRERSAINKCGEALRMNDLEWDGSKLKLAKKFETTLTERTVINSNTFVSDVEKGYLTIWNSPPLCDTAYLHAHGHLGESVIWIAVAVVAMSEGSNTELCNEFAFGRRDERKRFCQEWLIKAGDEHIAPLPELFA